jgi:hypothetical protein
VLEFVHFVLDLLEMTECSERRFMNSGARFEFYMLVEKTKSNRFRSHHIAAIRSFISGDETKDGALSSAVATYKTDVLSRIYLQ